MAAVPWRTPRRWPRMPRRGRRSSTIAEAIVAASKEVGFEVPLVVRLEGTEVEEGRRILEESDVEIITATDLTDAATKVCAAIGA